MQAIDIATVIGSFTYPTSMRKRFRHPTAGTALPVSSLSSSSGALLGLEAFDAATGAAGGRASLGGSGAGSAALPFALNMSQKYMQSQR
jgi:hypothetical protein